MNDDATYRFQEGDEVRYRGDYCVVMELLANHRYLICGTDDYGERYSEEVAEDKLSQAPNKLHNTKGDATYDARRGDLLQ